MKHDLGIVTTWLTKTYFPATPVHVEHIRSLTNDVYLVTTKATKFVLKIYGQGWRKHSEIAWELELLEHLFNKGVKLAKAQPGVNGETIQAIDFHSESRNAVLFDYAKGSKPKEPFLPKLYETEGIAVAEMHNASDDFTSKHNRHLLDLAYLIDKPINNASLYANPSESEFLARFRDHLTEHIESANQRGLDYGPIHGDMTQDNVHVTDEGEIYFYDFDSGGMGWRASDIQGWATASEDKPKWDAFIKGYREVRPLSENDIAVAPYLTAAWEVWGLSAEFTNRIAKDGDSAVKKYVSDHIVYLRTLEKRILDWEALSN